MKESITKFDINAAFKALDEIEIPAAQKGRSARNEVNLQETFRVHSKTEALIEDYYDLGSTEEVEEAKDDREDEIAKAKLARIEKIVDLDAESADELLTSYVGKVIVQCPQCMTLFYKNQEDLEPSDDENTVNVNETCQHCGNTSGYVVIGKVGAISEDEKDNFDLSDEDNELDLDFDEESTEEEQTEEPAEEKTEEESTEEKSEGEEDLDLDLVDMEEDEEEKNESLNASKAAESDEESEHKSENLTLNEDVEENEEEINEALLESLVLDEGIFDALGKVFDKVKNSKLGKFVDNKIADAKALFTNIDKVFTDGFTVYEFETLSSDPNTEETAGNIKEIEGGKFTSFEDAKKFAEAKAVELKNRIILIKNNPCRHEGQEVGQQTLRRYMYDTKTAQAKLVFDNAGAIIKELVNTKKAKEKSKAAVDSQAEAEKKAKRRDQFRQAIQDNDLLRHLVSTISSDEACDKLMATVEQNFSLILNDEGKLVPKTAVAAAESLNTSETAKSESKSENESDNLTLNEGCSGKECKEECEGDDCKLEEGKFDVSDAEFKSLLHSHAFNENVVEDNLNEFADDLDEDLENIDSVTDKAVDELSKVGKENAEPEVNESEEVEECIKEELPDEKTVDVTEAAHVDTPREVEAKLDNFADELAFEDLDEKSLDENINKYMTEVYANVKKYNTTECSLVNNKLVVEGVIEFNSGKTKNTKFTFRGNSANVLKGMNEGLADDTEFSLNFKNDSGILVTESIAYKYHIDNNLVEGFTGNK